MSESVCLAELPPRMQRIIGLLLRDAQFICAFDTGSVEYHWHRCGERDEIRPKFILNPPSEKESQAQKG